MTLLELLVVVGLILLLAGLILAGTSQARRRAAQVKCLSNLRQLATALHQYASDNQSRLPDPATSGISWEQMLWKYKVGLVLYCPSDEELSPTFGSSYDWRDTGHVASTLAGRPLATVRRSDAVLVFDAMPGWHAHRTVAAAFVDTSTAIISDKQLVDDLIKPIDHVGGGN